jgi:hypothetical protein
MVEIFHEGREEVSAYGVELGEMRNRMLRK